MIGNSCTELGQTHNRVVCGLQVGELLAQEVLQPGHIGQGEVVSRGERLSSGQSQTEEAEEAEQPCGTRSREGINYIINNPLNKPLSVVMMFIH